LLINQKLITSGTKVNQKLIKKHLTQKQEKHPIKIKQMIAPENKRRFWNKHKERGDVAELVALTGVTQPTITTLMKTGKGKTSLIIMVDSFYEQRVQSIQSK
jgi:hypothetical protein